MSSPSLNKVMLIGRAGKAPKVFRNATSVNARFSIATNERFTDRAGEKQERTTWHQVVAWGKTAEICEQYVKKGQLVYIEGSIRVPEQNGDGEKKLPPYEVVVLRMQLLGSNGQPKAEPAAVPDDDEEHPF